MLVKRTIWNHTKSPYKMAELLFRDPRIPKTHIARILKVNPKTIDLWYAEAVAKRIIIPPIFRRKSFKNFRERFYFINTDDPYKLYEELKDNKDILYYSVQTGFANFHIISKTLLDLKGDIVFEGDRSNYYVSIPPELTVGESVSQIKRKLELDRYQFKPSPLLYYNKLYEPWDDMDETIFWAVCNDVRKPVRQILREVDTYSDKVVNWFRTRDEFGHTITMYFPEGEGSYLLSTYAVETEYDSLLIDIFSCLPVTNVFYRIDDQLMMNIYLPFTLDGRQIAHKILSFLKEKELVNSYTNSIVEYYYRP